MDEKQITTDLNECLATEAELATNKWKKGYKDDWPVQKAYALN